MNTSLTSDPRMENANHPHEFMLDPLYWQLSYREYMEKLDKISTVEEAVKALWRPKGERYQGYGFYQALHPIQEPKELEILAKRVRAIQPKVIVEIGTAAGGTLYLWSRVSDALRLLVSIDVPGGSGGGGYPVQRGKLYQLFVANRPQCRLELLRMDSHQPETKQKLLDLLGGEPIDFLLIDGDHSYSGVKQDYEWYAPLVRSGGLIAFHDILPNPFNPTIEVHKLWREIAAGASHVEEIVAWPKIGVFGIGLLTKE